MNKILTTPEELAANPRVLYTGNHYLSLPEIDPETTAIKSLNLISLSNKGLVELKGRENLFKPSFYAHGSLLSPEKVEAWQENYYLPCFRFHFADHSPVEVKLYPDLTEKGFVYQFSSSEEVQVQLDCDPGELSFIRFNSHPVNFSVDFRLDKWLGNPLLDIRGSGTAFALAFGGEDSFSYQYDDFTLTLHLNCQGESAFYISLNCDPDGASTTLIHLKRKGYREIRTEFERWLAKKSVALPADPLLEEVLNLNLFFNYFYAIGKDIESDRYVALTSRSPRYYVSGAFWERDSFLWSFPALAIVDPDFAADLSREMILRHAANAGDHAHYIDGTVLYPGFELDEAASYFILLDLLPQEKIDSELIKALEKVLARIEREYDPKTGLYKTFLLPSDDPAEYPFVTIDQAILSKGFENLAALYRNLKKPEKADFLEERRRGIKEGVYTHLVKEIDGKKMFVWSADGKGNYRLYNDPPGNLGLLPYYRFVEPEDEIFINTINYYYSPQYHYYPENAAIQELACDHHPNTPSGLGLCGSLLNPLMRERALTWLKRAKMDHGLLAESYDKNSGEAKTGVAFATGSGYLAFALYRVLVEEQTR
ncbi:MAG: glycoside hydrolase family 125 protein [Firmicutes bacterium]|nr:glycoside hydrolase family 125 protein [Bacillota bacterium]